MKIHKRNKRSRIRGERRCGYGFGKKHRGKGSKGGKGMAGTGKRAAQKRTYIDKYMPEYFGRHGFKSLQQIKKEKQKIINLSEIQENLAKFIADGKAKKTAEGIEVNFEDYKILADGEVKDKLIIKAKSASLKAMQKVEKAGGKILLAKQASSKKSVK
jgi:large subunit ribosomal protein L15